MQEKKAGLLAAVRHLRLPHHHRLGRRLLPRARRDPPALARRCRGGSRTTSASRSRTATARSTPPSRAATASGSRCRSAPTRCTRSPRPASRRTGPTATASGSRTRFAVDPVRWIAQMTERLDEGEDHDEFLEHVKLEMYQDQVFCFTPKGDVVQLPRGRDADRLRLCDPHPHRRLPASAPRSTASGCRSGPRLKNGQSVEIIPPRASGRSRPGSDIVVTGRAKAAIRRSAARGGPRAIHPARRASSPASRFEHVGKKATDKALDTAAKRARPRRRRGRAGAARRGRDDRQGAGGDALSRTRARRRGRARSTTDARRWCRPRLRPGGPPRALLPTRPGRAHRRHHRSRPGRGDPRHRLRRRWSPSRTQPDRWIDLRWAEGQPPPPSHGDARAHDRQRRRRAGPHLHPDRRAARQHLGPRLHRPQARFLPHRDRRRAARRGTSAPTS